MNGLRRSRGIWSISFFHSSSEHQNLTFSFPCYSGIQWSFIIFWLKCVHQHLFPNYLSILSWWTHLVAKRMGWVFNFSICLWWCLVPQTMIPWTLGNIAFRWKRKAFSTLSLFTYLFRYLYRSPTNSSYHWQKALSVTHAVVPQFSNLHVAATPLYVWLLCRILAGNYFWHYSYVVYSMVGSHSATSFLQYLVSWFVASVLGWACAAVH